MLSALRRTGDAGWTDGHVILSLGRGKLGIDEPYLAAIGLLWRPSVMWLGSVHLANWQGKLSHGAAMQSNKPKSLRQSNEVC